MFISILALVLFAINSFISLDNDSKTIIDYGDNAICILFIIDFIITLYKSENRMKYLITWGWLDLVSSIPMVNAFRIGRFARIVRIFRVLRGVRSARILSTFILEHRAQSGFLAATLVSILLLIFGSVAVLEFEQTADANIKGPQDAIWWSLVMLTTVGYGDRYPVTPEGRIIAAILMTAGIGLFGTFSGFVAAWFLNPNEKKQENEIELLRKDTQELKELIVKKLIGISE